MSDYKDRFYESYAKNVADIEYCWSEEEYKLYAKANSIKYRSLLPINKKARILDIACGAGHFLYFLQKEGYSNAEGIDISEEQVYIAQKMEISNLYIGDFMEYILKHPNYYDTIVASHFIEHLTKEEIIDFLEAVKSSLKNKGRIILQTGNVASLFGASHISSDFTHEIGFTPRSCLQLLKTIGFKDVDVKGIGPVAYDFRSGIRVVLWKIIRKILTFYCIVERGNQRLQKGKRQFILEAEILVTGLG